MPQTNAPHLCMIFEATGPFNAIGRIAMAEVEAALSAGWRVSVVANKLADSLVGRVDWLRLYNPPKGFAFKWLTARFFIRRAMGDPGRFDLIHTHQPQVADLCDIYECHYLTRAVIGRGCFDARPGLAGVIGRFQDRIVVKAEERCFKRLTPKTMLLSCSELIRQEFEQLYGLPAREHVLHYPVPQVTHRTEAQRHAARANLVGDWSGPVVGFLGGLNHRKGYQQVLDACAADSSVFLLFAGSHSEQVVLPPALRGRCRKLGLLNDTDSFYSAIDALLVPSQFEPLGLVCFEAAAYGGYAIATETVGARRTLEAYGLVKGWPKKCRLSELMQDDTGHREENATRYKALADKYTCEQFACELSAVYAQALSYKSSGQHVKTLHDTSLTMSSTTR